MSLAGGASPKASRRTSRLSEDGAVLNARQHYLPPMPGHALPGDVAPNSLTPSSPPRLSSPLTHPTTDSAHGARALHPTKPGESGGHGSHTPLTQRQADCSESAGRGHALRLRSGLGTKVGAVGMKAMQPRRTAPAAPASPSPPTVQPPAHAERHSCDCHVHIDSFLRGVDIINRVFASAANPSGVAIPETTIWSSTPSPQTRQASSSPSPHGAEAESKHMRLVRAPLRPVILVTDGAHLLLVDRNGSGHHNNHQALAGCVRTQPAPSQGTTETPSVVWWTLEQLTAGPSRAGVVRREHDPVTAPVACAVAWLASSAQSKKMHGQSALAALSTPYDRPAQALVVLIRDARLVREALDDICHCYLPAMLESTYADGVQLTGVWVGPETSLASSSHTGQGDSERTTGIKSCYAFASPLWGTQRGGEPSALAGGTREATDPPGADRGTHVLDALYPNLRKERAQAAAAAQLGQLALPDALYDALVHARSAEMPRGAAAAHLAPSAPRTPPRSRGTAVGHTPAPRPRPPHQPQHGESKADKENTDDEPPGAKHHPIALEGGRVLGSRTDGTSSGTSRLVRHRSAEPHEPVTSVEPLCASSLSSPTPQLLGSPTTVARARSPPWGARGDGMYYGTYTPSGPPASDGQLLCQSVLLYTPRGRVELECVKGPLASDTATLGVVTVRDIKEGFARSALGRSLRLRRDQYALVYAPGLAPLLDEDIVVVAHAVLRLVRLNERV